MTLETKDATDIIALLTPVMVKDKSYGWPRRLGGYGGVTNNLDKVTYHLGSVKF